MTYQLNYIRTVPGMFAETCRKNASRVIYGEKSGDTWKTITYREARLEVEKIALGFREMGFEHGDRVAILSENRKEWTMTDLALAHIGVISVAVYATLPAQQIQYILDNSGAKGLCASNQTQLSKIEGIKKDLPELKFVFTYDELKSKHKWVSPFSELIAKGSKALKQGVDSLSELSREVKPEDIWTLIYTSGTTGNPKGVMLTQFNISTNVQAAWDFLKIKAGSRFLSFLPLSHSFERVVSHAAYYCGSGVYFAESLDKIADNLKEVKPNYMFSVPRIFEKVYGKLQSQIAIASPFKKKIFHWSENIGMSVAKKYITKQKRIKGFKAITYPIAKLLVFNKINKALGGNFVFCVSGGAPLPEHIGHFFAAAGILILEGFGLTETTPVTHITPPAKIKFGKVGVPMKDVQCVIAEDGEILVKGPNIMKGYYKNQLETDETIDKDGWLHTGDIGLIDEDGYLQITDRKKNIIVTSGGKNIAPAPIENKMLESEYIEQVVIMGDRRKFPIALIVPNQEKIELWAKENEILYEDYRSLLNYSKIEKLYETELASFQQQLARFEQSKKFILLHEMFTVENEMMTPSLKVRRKKVEERYKDQIDSLYGE